MYDHNSINNNILQEYQQVLFQIMYGHDSMNRRFSSPPPPKKTPKNRTKNRNEGDKEEKIWRKWEDMTTYPGSPGVMLFCIGCCICILLPGFCCSGVLFFWCLSNNNLPKSSHHIDSIAVMTKKKPNIRKHTSKFQHACGYIIALSSYWIFTFANQKYNDFSRWSCFFLTWTQHIEIQQKECMITNFPMQLLQNKWTRCEWTSIFKAKQSCLLILYNKQTGLINASPVGWGSLKWQQLPRNSRKKQLQFHYSS